MHIPLLTTLLVDAGQRLRATPAPPGQAPASGHGAAGHVLVLDPLPDALVEALASRHPVHRSLPEDASVVPRISVLVAGNDSVVDRHLISALPGLRLVVVHGPSCARVDLYAALMHRVRVAAIPCECVDEASRTALILANLDACFVGAPLPTAVV